MDIKTKLKYALILPVFLFTGSRCTNEAKWLERVPESDFIENCPDVLYDFGDMVTVSDPNEKFYISLPYSWDIRESYSDSLYGIFASNFLSIPKAVDDRMSVSVTGYNSDKELDQYFLDELAELATTENINVIERGKSMLDGEKYPWLLFEMKDGIFNMVYYVKEPATEDIFLIQAVSYDTVNYKSKMCYLKQLINSFGRGKM